MRVIGVQEPSLSLDTCKPCALAWFDPAEFETIPEGAIESVDELELRGRQALAEYQLEQMAKQTRAEDPLPDSGWKWLPAAFGFPVELDEADSGKVAWATWSLCAAIALVSLIAFSDLRATVWNFGLVPAKLWRYGGFTFISSFFLHGGWLHLIGNLYFLALLGNNVEAFLGARRFLLLMILATLMGDGLHIMLDPRSTVPSIGASGGISGIIAFYALQFPRARIGFLTRFRWIQLPAWGAFVIWMLMQLWGAVAQYAGFSNVSAFAHLGGVGMGAVFWFCFGDSWNKPSE